MPPTPMTDDERVADYQADVSETYEAVKEVRPALSHMRTTHARLLRLLNRAMDNPTDASAHNAARKALEREADDAKDYSESSGNESERAEALKRAANTLYPDSIPSSTSAANGKDYSGLAQSAAAASKPARRTSRGRRQRDAGMRQGGAGTPSVKVVRK